MKEVKERKDIAEKDKWDLTLLCKDRQDFEKKHKEFLDLLPQFKQYKGRVTESKETLLEVLKLETQVYHLADVLGSYGSLRTSVDQGDAEAQELDDIGGQLWSMVSQCMNGPEQEIKDFDEDTLRKWISEKEFDDYKTIVEDILYFKKCILSEKEERIMSMFNNCSRGHENTFNALLNKSINFGTVTQDGKEIQLTSNNYYSLMKNKDRELRKTVFSQYRNKMAEYENTFASIYSNVVKQNVFKAQVRDFDTALDQSMFNDKLDKKIVTSLIESAHKNIEVKYRYLRLLKKFTGFDPMYSWDTSIPVFTNKQEEIDFDGAAELVLNAVSPLGEEYKTILKNGINNRWIDKYDNKDKINTSFCSPTYGENQLIMLHFEDLMPQDVYTLIHECGHAMHSYYSAKSVSYNDFYPKSIDAEVASTFNEHLLFRYLSSKLEGDSKKELLFNRIKSMCAYMFNQSFYTEYEIECHKAVEEGKPLTAKYMRELCERLSDFYNGNIIEKTDLPKIGLYDVPHFYFSNPYYNYKYAISFAASAALEEGLHNNPAALESYIDFLKSGGKYDTVTNLKNAGVDITDPKSLDIVYTRLNQMMDELEKLI